MAKRNYVGIVNKGNQKFGNNFIFSVKTKETPDTFEFDKNNMYKLKNFKVTKTIYGNSLTTDVYDDKNKKVITYSREPYYKDDGKDKILFEIADKLDKENKLK